MRRLKKFSIGVNLGQLVVGGILHDINDEYHGEVVALEICLLAFSFVFLLSQKNDKYREKGVENINEG